MSSITTRSKTKTKRTYDGALAKVSVVSNKKRNLRSASRIYDGKSLEILPVEVIALILEFSETSLTEKVLLLASVCKKFSEALLRFPNFWDAEDLSLTPERLSALAKWAKLQSSIVGVGSFRAFPNVKVIRLSMCVLEGDFESEGLNGYDESSDEDEEDALYEEKPSMFSPSQAKFDASLKSISESIPDLFGDSLKIHLVGVDINRYWRFVKGSVKFKTKGLIKESRSFEKITSIVLKRFTLDGFAFLPNLHSLELECVYSFPLNSIVGCKNLSALSLNNTDFRGFTAPVSERPKIKTLIYSRQIKTTAKKASESAVRKINENFKSIEALEVRGMPMISSFALEDSFDFPEMTRFCYCWRNIVSKFTIEGLERIATKNKKLKTLILNEVDLKYVPGASEIQMGDLYVSKNLRMTVSPSLNYGEDMSELWDSDSEDEASCGTHSYTFSIHRSD